MEIKKVVELLQALEPETLKPTSYLTTIKTMMNFYQVIPMI